MIAVMGPATVYAEENGLVRAAGLGDRAAFGELYSRYARTVHGILLARVPAADAEDLVQDVFISALKQLALLRDPGAFRGWLFAIARNRAIDYHRDIRNKTEVRGGELPERASSAEKREGGIILDAIRKLPEAYRETLILRFVEGMTGPEIATRTGLTPDSVRVNLCRGMKMLRERLEGGAAK